MKEKTGNGKKSGASPKGPVVNERRGDYNGSKIISGKTGKHNPASDDNTIRAYPIPMTVKQEAAIGATIKL
jgi:hypothetical protein